MIYTSSIIIFQILCIIFTLLYLTNFLYYLLICVNSLHIKDKQFLSILFTLVSDLGFFWLVFFLVKLIWIDSRKLLYFLNSTRFDINKNDHEIQKLIVVYRGIQLLTILGFISFTYFDSILFIPIHFNENVDCSNASAMINEKDPFMWFLEKVSLWFSPLPYRNIIIFLLEVHIHKFFFICHAFVFLLTCTIFALGWQFKRDILSIGFDNIRVGIKAYRKLKQKMEMIKDLTGSHVLAFNVVNIAYYCQLPEIIFGDIKYETVPSVIFYMLINISVWILASEFHVQVENSFCKWHDKCLFRDDEEGDENVETIQNIQTQISMETQLKLMSIQNEFHTTPIGLSCQFFTVTYGFLRTVITHTYISYRINF